MGYKLAAQSGRHDRGVRRVLRTGGSLIAATTLALTLASCSSDTDGKPSASKAPTTGAGVTETSSAPATQTSTSTPSGSLSKDQFVSQANTLCAGVNKQRDAVPAPSGPSDFAAVSGFFVKTLALYEAYLAQAKALVAQSPDAEQLNKQWISVEAADFEQVKPLITQIIAAANKKDQAAVSSLVDKLGAAPDHSDEIAKFMTSYGLTDCAALQSS